MSTSVAAARPDQGKALSVLAMNTIAFTACFACWMMYGVLVTFLINNGIFNWDKAQMGWLIGIPVLTGSVLRLPVGILTDKYGGRPVFALLMLLSAVGVYSVSLCNTFEQFLLAGLWFGVSGASFAVGIAYTSVWFSKNRQGTALGIFGAGNAGAAITSLGAPHLLAWVTQNGHYLDGWRMMPRIYAAGLLLMTVLFWFLTFSKKVEHGQGFTMAQRLAPLKDIRVWRFGLYYFYVFGGFVALSQWLIPYYVNVYTMSLATAGLMATCFSLPSGVIRAIGGWMSDHWGARSVMYVVLSVCLICTILLSIPRMDIESPGEGVMAFKKGVVTAVSPQSITVDAKTYPLKPKDPNNIMTIAKDHDELLVWPTLMAWQEPVVQVGDKVAPKQLLARGVTHIFFQANLWIFTVLVFLVGVLTGIGKAAVYRYIPDYFPKDVGVVGGIVGVIGGLGGFVGPIIFGYLLNLTGIWTTTWMFFTLISAVCLAWMHWTVTRMMYKRSPGVAA
jgi:NNP family nitrate/nitrite transporter-like MFS transporter